MGINTQQPHEQTLGLTLAGSREPDPPPRGSMVLLTARRGGPAERFASVLPTHRPAVTFALALVAAFAAFAALSIGIGLLVTELLLEIGGVTSADRSVVTELVENRSATATDVSFIGSSIAGGLVLPILVGSIALVCAFRRQWLVAAFAIFSLSVESAIYRATTLVIHRDRPDVERLEQLPVDASYPSGHTAAAVAVYAGLALLITSRSTSGPLRAVAWTVAIAIALFVATSRIYRGMHHPIDTVAGVTVGIFALIVVVFACRAADLTARSRQPGRAGAKR